MVKEMVTVDFKESSLAAAFSIADKSNWVESSMQGDGVYRVSVVAQTGCERSAEKGTQMSVVEVDASTQVEGLERADSSVQTAETPTSTPGWLRVYRKKGKHKYRNTPPGKPSAKTELGAYPPPLPGSEDAVYRNTGQSHLLGDTRGPD